MKYLVKPQSRILFFGGSSSSSSSSSSGSSSSSSSSSSSCSGVAGTSVSCGSVSVYKDEDTGHTTVTCSYGCNNIINSIGQKLDKLFCSKCTQQTTVAGVRG